MPHAAPRFLLLSKGTVLGTIQFSHEDWPWNYGSFFPAESFRDVADLFSHEACLLKVDSQAQKAEREAAIRQIVDLELELRHEEGGTLAGKPDILYIRGDEASWRGFDGGLLGKI